MRLTKNGILSFSRSPASIWKRGIACQVKSHRHRCEENGDQLNGYVDFHVHIDIYVVAITQHKACTRCWLKGDQRTAMVLRGKIRGPVSYWREHLDDRNLRFSSPATLVP